MSEDRKEKMIKIMNMVMEDTERDANEFDGKPFNGRTMAIYMGNHGAAIKAVANAVKEILEEEGSDE